MDEAFTLLDGDFHVLDANRLALQIDGRPREDLIGKTLWELAPGLEESPFGALLKQAMEHRKTVSTEHNLVWPDGHAAWIEARAFPVEQGLAVVYRDFTERREAEDALRTSEEINRRILQSSTDCIKVLSLDGTLEFMSEGGTRVMEVDDLPGLLGKNWAEFWPEEERHKVAEALGEAKQGGSCRFRGAAPTIKGNLRWWDVAVSAILDADGRPERLLAISRDVSPAHIAEQQLADTTRRLDAVLNNTTMAVFLMDHQQQCVFANSAAEELTGYSFAQMTGRPLHDVVHHTRPDGSPYPLEECPIDRAFPTSAQMQGEETFVAPDGSFYPVAFTASPVVDDLGVSIGTVIEARNITEEKSREAALARRSTQLHQLAEAALETAAAPNLDATLDLVTHAARRIIQAHQAVVSLTRGPDWSQAINTVALTEKYEQWADYSSVPDGSGIYAWLCETNRPARFTQEELEAHPRWRGFGDHAANHPPMRGWLAVPLTARDGRNLGLIQLSDKKDGSEFDEEDEAMLVQLAQLASAAVEQNLAEMVLQELNETLEQRVAEEVGERSKAEEALRQAQKMEAVGQLTGGIAHDFNNLLAGISGSLEVIERRLSRGQTEGIDKFIAGAQTSAQRAAALTQRLLAFSRRQTLDPKPTDVNRLVLGMEDLIRRTVGPSMAVEVVGAAGLWITKVDQAQLESALLNLAINARDAMPQGGRITIETANKWLDDRAGVERDLPPGQYISICVTDSGTGIPKDIADRIFDPFFTTKPIGQGTGLGLSMVHGFLRQSGGQIRVYSEEGHGTTMCLYLPRFSGVLDDDEGMGSGEIAELGAGETVLVIDDEPTVRMLIVEVLLEAGYSALEAEDGPSGLKILETGAQVDLLVTDVGLPGGMNGREVADAARALRPGLKVLFVTGFAENAAVGNGLLDAGMEVMTKPFAMTDLADKITQMIES